MVFARWFWINSLIRGSKRWITHAIYGITNLSHAQMFGLNQSVKIFYKLLRESHLLHLDVECKKMTDCCSLLSRQRWHRHISTTQHDTITCLFGSKQTHRWQYTFNLKSGVKRQALCNQFNVAYDFSIFIHGKIGVSPTKKYNHHTQSNRSSQQATFSSDRHCGVITDDKLEILRRCR